jgi:xanthine/uracil permease
MSASEEPVTGLIYGLDVRPPLRETRFVALQHVFAVFVGMITPPLLIANALKLHGPGCDPLRLLMSDSYRETR